MASRKRLIIYIPKHRSVQPDGVRLVAFFSFLVVVCLPFITIRIAGVGLLLIIGIPLMMLSAPAILNKLRRMDIPSVLLFLFFLYGLCGYIWTPRFSMNSLYGYVKNVAIVLCLYCQTYREKEKKLLVAGSIISCLIVGFFMISGSGNIGYLEGRAVISIFGEMQDPNYTGFLFIIPMAWCVQGFLNKTSKWTKILYAAFCLSIVYCVLLTGSRGALIALLVVGVVGVANRYETMWGKIAFCLLIGSVALGLFVELLKYLPDSIAARFEIDIMLKSRGEGRLDIWINAFEAIRNAPQKLLFGFGTSSSLQVIGRATHNYFIQLLLELGVVGLGLFMGFYCVWTYRLIKNHDIQSLSILSGCLGLAMSLSVNTEYRFWVTLIMGIVCRKQAGRGERR